MREGREGRRGRKEGKGKEKKKRNSITNEPVELRDQLCISCLLNGDLNLLFRILTRPVEL